MFLHGHYSVVQRVTLHANSVGISVVTVEGLQRTGTAPQIGPPGTRGARSRVPPPGTCRDPSSSALSPGRGICQVQALPGDPNPIAANGLRLPASPNRRQTAGASAPVLSAQSGEKRTRLYTVGVRRAGSNAHRFHHLPPGRLTAMSRVRAKGRDVPFGAPQGGARPASSHQSQSSVVESGW